MSPEQLAGKAETVRSDIYSLGLVLYEMFTGKRAFKWESLRDYKRLHTSEDPTAPSEIVDDIDPIVERADFAVSGEGSGRCGRRVRWRWRRHCRVAIRCGRF